MKSLSRVRVIHGGEPLKGRVLEISGSAGTFETPTRTPTSTDLNAKIRIHFDEPWDNPIYEVANRFNSTEQLVSLHRRNGSYSNKLREVKAQVNRFTGYSLTKYFPQLPMDTVFSERDIRVLVDLQLEANCDIISIPEPGPDCSPTAFYRNLSKFWEYTSDYDKNRSVMPYVLLKQDHELFEMKLRLLAEHEHSLWGIGIRSASLQDYRPNLMSLAEFASKDFWVHLSGGRRYAHYTKPQAQLHALQRFGIDSVATEVPMAASGPNNDIERVRYFDRDTITYPRMLELCPHGEELGCACPMCNHGTVEDMVEMVRPHGPADELVLRMNDAAKVHEVYASTLEFEAARAAIKDGNLTDYFRTKDGLHSFLSLDDPWQ